MTYRLGCELGWVVVDVGDPDDGGGCVGQAVQCGSLHVCGLDDQRVLWHFLIGKIAHTHTHKDLLN